MDLAAFAYYNWGRWVADCPDAIDGCKCAVDLKRGETKFHCRRTILRSWTMRRRGASEREIEAMIAANGSDPEEMLHDCGADGALIIWPEDPKQIEDICAHRPLANRNWHPWETIDVLRGENIEHGIRVE